MLHFLTIDKHVTLSKTRVFSYVRSVGKNYTPTKSEPITLEMVQRYCRGLGDKDKHLSDKLFASISYYCAARSCEVSTLLFDKIRRCDNALEIEITRTKTDRSGTSSVLVVPGSPDPSVCPVAIYDRYRALLPVAAVRAFLYFSGDRYVDRLVGANTIKKIPGLIAEAAGVTGRFTSHSFRSGAATDYVDNGGA